MNSGKLLPLFLVLLLCGKARAQDPSLPSVNVGFSNMQAGRSRPPGLYYVQYIQAYQAEKRRNADGNEVDLSSPTSSIVGLQQIVFISKKELLSGNLGATAISIVSKTVPAGNSDIKVNPSPFGDIVLGPFIQWYDKKLFGLPYWHRFGINVGIPIGAYSDRYQVNPSAHLFRIFPHYEFTLSPVNHISLSIKNNFYYFFNEIGTERKPGFTYNMNYALEYAFTKSFTVELAGYWVSQLKEDSFQGNSNYYQDTFNIPTTKERVFAVGPGIGLSTASGFGLEAKVMWEQSGVNRNQGVRSTLVFSYKL